MEVATNTIEDISQSTRVQIRRPAITEDELKKDIDKLKDCVAKQPDTQNAIHDDGESVEKEKETAGDK